MNYNVEKMRDRMYTQRVLKKMPVIIEIPLRRFLFLFIDRFSYDEKKREIIRIYIIVLGIKRKRGVGSAG